MTAEHNAPTEQIRILTEEVLPYITELRRDLHRHPELSEQEVWTENRICAELEAIGLPYRRGVAGHGVTADITGTAPCGTDSRPKRAVAIRADIDALPLEELNDVPYRSEISGAMHACGHDFHTAILIGTAKVLTQMRSCFAGTVRLLFQPAEETIGGADRMIQEGCLRDPEITDVIGLHLASDLCYDMVEIVPGAMNAASRDFHITVRGKGGHGAYPQECVDPLIPACEMVLGFQTMLSRQFAATDSNLITVSILNSGSVINVIPNETNLSGIIRTLESDRMEPLTREIRTLCEGVAAAHGASVQVEIGEGYPLLYNDPVLQEDVTRAVSDIIGEDRIRFTKGTMGTDDFAFFCHAARGFFYNLGILSQPDDPVIPLHSRVFCPDERCIRTGILTEAASVLQILAGNR
ncbi:MAG: amidohydrolase [Mogibacterium sp.]|nr:amidohydrolase [Mogibacterium sp.]